MARPSLRKIFGVGPLGGLISIGLLLGAVWIDRRAGWGTVTQHSSSARGIGVVLLLLGVGLHAWSFMTLRQWWVESRLCTRGPFRFVRHPMYAAWISLIAPGLVLILNRWSGVFWLAALHPFWHVLVRREEHAMERHFGEVYRRYAARTGRFLPRPGAVRSP